MTLSGPLLLNVSRLISTDDCEQHAFVCHLNCVCVCVCVYVFVCLCICVYVCGLDVGCVYHSFFLLLCFLFVFS